MSHEYRLTQLDAAGDTIVVIQVAASGRPVSAEERREEAARVEEFMERAGRVVLDWDEVIPQTKPIIQRLAAADDGSVWVQREGEPGPTLEQFSAGGEFIRSIELLYPVARYHRPVIQRGWILTVQTDSLDVQSVVGSRLPG